MKFLNPAELRIADLPLIVLADDRRSFLGWAIKAHSGGQYNHIMEMTELGVFASQHFTGYKEILVEKYMKPYVMLKFWRVELRGAQKTLWDEAVKADLNAPWLNRRYDFLGIIGQFFHIPKLQSSFANYCGERVIDRLNYILKTNYPSQSDPSEANEIFKKDKLFSVAGYWHSD